ncbi:MAG: hypothetical protein KatS3mg054_0668 [Chloroflexus sp.]|jgi:hypothetical protein|nr:MAG: hypothetical protein KatS3mg047_1075 [Bellilinea sp.]GIV86639.1 MAG: hypothetical protein KatS3mg054_0668 [Chloroflexus sp.]
MNISIQESLQIPKYFSSFQKSPEIVWKSALLKTSSSVLLSIGAMNSMMITTMFNASSSRDWRIMTEKKSPFVYNSEDPEILAMSEEEIRAEVLAAFGAWADRDDITDDWLDGIRRGWSDRLDDLYSEQSKD